MVTGWSTCGFYIHLGVELNENPIQMMVEHPRLSFVAKSYVMCIVFAIFPIYMIISTTKPLIRQITRLRLHTR